MIASMKSVCAMLAIAFALRFLLEGKWLLTLAYLGVNFFCLWLVACLTAVFLRHRRKLRRIPIGILT